MKEYFDSNETVEDSRDARNINNLQTILSNWTTVSVLLTQSSIVSIISRWLQIFSINHENDDCVTRIRRNYVSRNNLFFENFLNLHSRKTKRYDQYQRSQYDRFLLEISLYGIHGVLYSSREPWQCRRTRVSPRDLSFYQRGAYIGRKTARIGIYIP